SDALLLELVGDSRQAWTEAEAPLIDMLQQAAQPASGWSTALSLALVSRIRAGLADATGAHWTLKYALPIFAGVVDPAALAAYEQGWPGTAAVWEHWQKPVGDFLTLVRFRGEMMQ